MIIMDVVWNLFRKSLNASMYRKLKNGPLGRPYNYHSIETYRDIFKRYAETGYDFTSKHILEVGCGLQFFTAYFFIKAGAASVTLVDPLFTQNISRIQSSHLRQFEKVTFDSPLLSRAIIESYSSLEKLLSRKRKLFNFICSHFVLEHIDNLDCYFNSVYQLLTPDGISYNVVDLSNHAYHIFDSRIWTKWLYRKNMLSHLRYSDSFYNAITDKRIWVNRLLLPTYKALAVRHQLFVKRLDTILNLNVPIHSDVLEKNHSPIREDLYATHFSLLLEKMKFPFKKKMYLQRNTGIPQNYAVYS